MPAKPMIRPSRSIAMDRSRKPRVHNPLLFEPKDQGLRVTILLINLTLTAAAFLVVFKLADYPTASNPDRISYETDFHEVRMAFEIGYEGLQFVCRDLLSFSFEQFWTLLICVEIGIVLLALYVYHSAAVLLAMPTLVYVSQTIIGTQVRYGFALSALFAALVAWKKRKLGWMWIWACIAATVHYSAISLFAAIATVVGMQKLIAEKEARWGRQKTLMVKAILGVLLLCVLLAVAQSIEAIAVQTKYNTYIDTEFFDRKSLLSVLYSFLMLAALLLTSKQRNETDRALLTAHGFLLAAVLILQQYAILGGRVLICSMYFEPVSVIILAKSPVVRDKVIAAGILTASALKLLSMSFYGIK